MKIQKEYLILIAVICILVVILIISSGRDRMTYKLPQLDKIEQNSINKIEIITPEDSILLEKSQDEWLIMPQEYAVDTDKVEEMLDVIGSLTLTELVSDKENYQRYELDEENRIHVKAFKGEKLIREFFIGKVSSTYSHTYVRLTDSIHVFHARDSFQSTFEQNKSGLRDKLVMEFGQEEITTLVLEGEFGSLELNKELRTANTKEEEPEASPKEEEVWLTIDGEEADTSVINSVLSKLSNLNCDYFLDEEEKQEFEDPVYTLIARGEKDYKLEIYQQREDEDEYPSLSSENKFPFLLTKYMAESLMKKPNDIFKKNTED